MEVLRKKWKHTVIQKYFFLEILINVKAGRVNEGARKVYHGRRVGQACHKPFNKICVGGIQTDSKVIS
jgi:hypothetical protein